MVPSASVISRSNQGMFPSIRVIVTTGSSRMIRSIALAVLPASSAPAASSRSRCATSPAGTHRSRITSPILRSVRSGTSTILIAGQIFFRRTFNHKRGHLCCSVSNADDTGRLLIIERTPRRGRAVLCATPDRSAHFVGALTIQKPLTRIRGDRRTFCPGVGSAQK